MDLEPNAWTVLLSGVVGSAVGVTASVAVTLYVVRRQSLADRELAREGRQTAAALALLNELQGINRDLRGLWRFLSEDAYNESAVLKAVQSILDRVTFASTLAQTMSTVEVDYFYFESEVETLYEQVLLSAGLEGLAEQLQEVLSRVDIIRDVLTTFLYELHRAAES